MTLILTLTSLANQLKSRDAWTVLLNHHLDTLALCGGNHVGLQTSTPFLLLRLNRDGHAYVCCRHALRADWTDSELDSMAATVRTNSNYRFRDVVEDFGGEQGLNRFTNISYVVALAILKMRLVAMYESLLEEVDASAATSSCRILGPDVQAEVRQYLVGRAEVERKWVDQSRQLIILLDWVQSRNISVLPALLYPEPMLRVPTPFGWPPGSPLEARYVLDLALELWRDIPGSDRILQTRFGTATPLYPMRQERRETRTRPNATLGFVATTHKSAKTGGVGRGGNRRRGCLSSGGGERRW